MEYTETAEKQITRRQHYVPKSYLKNFVIGNQKAAQVYVVFSDAKDAKTVSIDDICCRSYLYDQIAIDPDSKTCIFAAPNEIENSFIELEGEYAAIVTKLKNDLRDAGDFELTPEETDKLKRFMSLLLFRNPIFVHISNCVVDRLYANNPEYIKRIKSLFPDIPQNVYISMLANEFLKIQVSPEIGLLPRAMTDTMKHSQLCVFRAQNSVFVTSAMPVVNIYGENDEIEYDLLGMPITPELFLAFVDTDYHIPRVVTIDDCSVKRINGRQVNKAGRLLISNKKDLLSYIDFSIDIEKKDDEWLYEMLHTDKETALSQYEDILNTKEIKYWR